MSRVINFALMLVAAILLSTTALADSFSSPDNQRKIIAVTFDDLPLNGPPIDIGALETVYRQLIDGMRSENVPAIGFVNEELLYQPIGDTAKKIELLSRWISSGFEVGNHTFSHRSINDGSVAAYEKNIVLGETVIKNLASDRPLRYFRYPFLQTGADPQVKEVIKHYLAERHYTIAPVTIDAHDWMFNVAYLRAKNLDPAEANRVAQLYLDYTAQMVSYSEELSQQIFGRQMKQILLLHLNRLNADLIQQLIFLLRRARYEFATLDEALTDSAYQINDGYLGSDGPTWLTRWALARSATVAQPPPEIPSSIKRSYELQYLAQSSANPGHLAFRISQLATSFIPPRQLMSSFMCVVARPMGSESVANVQCTGFFCPVKYTLLLLEANFCR